MKDTIVVDGVEYIRRDSANLMAEPDEDGALYVIIRADKSGVHAGYLHRRGGDEVKLRQSRRIWYWDGAASISQLAVDGTSRPENCKFSVPVPQITVLGVIEVIPCTEEAQRSIQGVPEWRA